MVNKFRLYLSMVIEIHEIFTIKAEPAVMVGKWWMSGVTLLSYYKKWHRPHFFENEFKSMRCSISFKSLFQVIQCEVMTLVFMTPYVIIWEY
jgi:hypothetical protein